MREEDSDEGKTPNLPLNKEALAFLRLIFSYTKVLAIGLEGIKGDEEVAKLFKQNSELQYATIKQPVGVALPKIVKASSNIASAPKKGPSKK